MKQTVRLPTVTTTPASQSCGPVVHTNRTLIAGTHPCSWSSSGSHCCGHLQEGSGQGHAELPQKHSLSWQMGHVTTAPEIGAGALAMANLPPHTSWLPVVPTPSCSSLALLPKAVPGLSTAPHCPRLTQDLHHYPRTHRFKTMCPISHPLLPPNTLFFMGMLSKQRLGLPGLWLCMWDCIYY